MLDGARAERASFQAGHADLFAQGEAPLERRVLASVGIRLGKTLDTMALSCRVRGADASGGYSLAAVCRRKLGLALDKTPQTSN